MNDRLHNIFYNQGLQNIRDFKLEEGRKRLIKAIAFDNSQIATWNLLGLVYYRLGRYISADYCWKVSVDLDTSANSAIGYLKASEQEFSIVEPYLARINDLIKVKSFKKAKKVIREIPEQIANKVDILNFFGLIMLLGSDADSARAYWIKSLGIAVDGMVSVYLPNTITLKNRSISKFSLIKYLKGR